VQTIDLTFRADLYEACILIRLCVIVLDAHSICEPPELWRVGREDSPVVATHSLEVGNRDAEAVSIDHYGQALHAIEALALLQHMSDALASASSYKKWSPHRE
jgi:hypothetical protein